MAEQNTRADQSPNWNHLVATSLDQSVHQIGFFQAVRRVEELARDMPRVGHASQVDREAIRIRQSAELDFAAATIEKIDSADDGRAQLSQRFFGLLGPGGPLPLYMTELTRHQTRHENDPTLEAFLNLFHHRMATLFYRAWSSSRGAIQRDRPDEDRYADYLGAISGVMQRPGTDGNDNETQLHFTGRFASTHRNAEGLRSIVSSTLRASVDVRSHVLRHLRLEPEDRTLLSTQSSPGGRGGQLGQSVVLGRSVPDRRSLVALRIGPIDFDLFQSLLPGGSLHQTLRKLIRGYVDPAIDCRIRLILNHRTVPRMSLGRQGRLGRNAWVHSRPPTRDADDCQFLV